MREILFRGKRIDNGEWVEGYLIEKWSGKETQTVFAIDTCRVFEKNGFDSVDVYLVYPTTVGQFTGLLDKNGKRIFEGDVYKIRGCWPKYTVVWNSEYAQFCLASEGATVGVYPVHEQLADMTWLGNLWDKDGE